MAHPSPGLESSAHQTITDATDRDQLVEMLGTTRDELARTSASLRERDARLRAAQDALQGQEDLSALRTRELIDGRDALRHALDVARVATWSVDLTLGRFDWSPNAYEILGLAPDAPIDTLEGFFAQIVEEDARRLQALAEAAGRGEQIPWEWEYRICAPDGAIRWFSSRGRATTDPHAVVVSGVTFDITEQRELQEQLRDREQMLSGLISASPDGIVVSGLGGRIRLASDGIFDIIGIRPDELIDRHTREFIEAELHNTLVESTNRLRTDPQGIEQVRLRLLHSRGHVVTVDCRMRLLTDAGGGADGFVIVVRDVSEQARLEAELARARDEAEAANRAKSDYLSRMSHELRTPMNSVLGFAQVLELSELSPADRDSLDRILGAGRHLLQLIDDVLDISRVEAGQFQISLAPVSVRDVVADAADLLRPQLSDAALELSVDVCELMWVTADHKRLSQVLINLLSNAVKYNRPGGEIVVACSPTEVGWFRLAVTDTGVGIAEDHLPLLFGPFERLGADRTDVPGTGLGLALSRTLVEAMGGRIGGDSVLGEGSTFWVDLPAAQPGRPVDTDMATKDTALTNTMRTS